MFIEKPVVVEEIKADNMFLINHFSSMGEGIGEENTLSRHQLVYFEES